MKRFTIHSRHAIWLHPLAGIGLLVILFFGCVYQSGPGTYQPGEELSGGATTVFDVSRNAFSHSARNLSFERRSAFFVGNSFFKQNWVMAPASTAARDGLGPFFSGRSCTSCHLRDGRGRPPLPDGESLNGMSVHISVPGQAEHGGPRPSPAYGLAFSTRAIRDVAPEGRVKLTYKKIEGRFADGTPYALRKPVYTLITNDSKPVDSTLLVSPRVAPAVIGMGLLEAIPAETLRELADPNDQNNDGISGRVNQVWSVYHQKMMPGRFGWKANEPTVPDQVISAFHADMGLTTSYLPEQNCTKMQKDCLAQPGGGTPEVSDNIVDKVSFYIRTLAVPARRNVKDPQVLKGERLFHEAGCAGCHIPRLQTGTFEGFPELSHQTIRPYTDLLLHDMGEGLADGRPDYKATGREWRTPPLWGIGLVETVNGHTYFLHDGRARNLTEAILWHGGEAKTSREKFRRMSKEERNALIAFLKSL